MSRLTRQLLPCPGATFLIQAQIAAAQEDSYENALCEALARQNIRFERERTFRVKFENVAVGKYRPDLIVEDTVVVEVKSVDRLIPLFTSQVISYLKVTQLRVGLILNFNAPRMADGIKRVVL